MHVAHARNLLPTRTWLNRESGTTSKQGQYTDVERLTRLAPDVRRCIPYLLYYGDVSYDMFRLFVQQMRPFGVHVIFCPLRASVHHLEERGVMGYFIGPGDGPSMDPVYITKGMGAAVSQHRHVVTPLVCLEMHASLMRCAADNAEALTEQLEAGHLADDHARLAPFERGLFEITDRDVNEVPYHNDEFMQQVKGIATFNVRAAPPPPAGAASASARGRNVSCSEGEHPKLSKQRNQPGRALTSVDCPYNECPVGTVRLPPPISALVTSREAHRHTPEVAADVVAQTCQRLLTLREPGLRPTWGLDAEHPAAAYAHECTEEHIREAHRDRHTVDCGNSGMSPDFDILQSLAGGAALLETEGSEAGLPAEAPHELAPPPHPAAIGNASPVRGWGELRPLPWQRGGSLLMRL